MRSSLQGDDQVGAQILKRALQEPLPQLVRKLDWKGVSPSSTCDAKAKGDWGFGVVAAAYVNVVDAGIIDPAKVTRCALENAARVAVMILSSEHTSPRRQSTTARPVLQVSNGMYS